MGKSNYIEKWKLEQLFFLMHKENALALRVSLYTGLRIGDVLSLKTRDIQTRFTIFEEKTGKKRLVRLSGDLLDDLVAISGKIYVFEGRKDIRKHRTRQAVYADLRRVSRIVKHQIGKKQITPHTARKVYAVDKLKYYGGDLKRVQSLLNHDREAVTILYALADKLGV